MTNNIQPTAIPSLEIDLHNHPDKFVSDSQKLLLEKKINFIFGRNGTGKTTISDEILRQLSDGYDVCVYKDFEGVIENDRLNAIALGTVNSKIQKDIDNVDKEINKINNQIRKPENSTEDNLYTKAVKSDVAYNNQQNKINKYFTTSAKKIKNLSDPQIAKTSYDKSSFQEDVLKANLLNDDCISDCIKTIKADEKMDIEHINMLDIDLELCLTSTNKILQSCVSRSIDIPELTENQSKQNFAREGMRIHEHKSGEKCAFCGNDINDERWKLLGNYFNEEVKKMENVITNEITNIELKLNTIQAINTINEDIFYDKFRQEINKINLNALACQKDYTIFLENLKSALEKKRNNLFSASPLLNIAIPCKLKEIEKLGNAIIDNHNILSLTLKSEQDKAKETLRLNEVKKLLNEFNYDVEKSNLLALQTVNIVAQKNLNDAKQELGLHEEKRKALILQTRDEEKIATKINDLLLNMGVISFSLKLVDDTAEGQKGQYQIKGYGDCIRPITKLSKGEKNIIAFLYFVFSLESLDSSKKPKIIVLDDPMTSNDDTMQYLMIGEIQKLYRHLDSKNYLIVLTHNCHFYLNVRPNTAQKYKVNKEEISFYEKYGVFHLLSDGKRTTIKNICDGKSDFSTSYETLWKELVFLYSAKDAVSDLMLSPCRKICETYMKFTKKGIDKFYGENINAKKLFDVNQHSVDDFEAETNGKTKEEIKTILFQLFIENGSEDHINSYWKTGESQ